MIIEFARKSLHKSRRVRKRRRKRKSKQRKATPKEEEARNQQHNKQRSAKVEQVCANAFACNSFGAKLGAERKMRAFRGSKSELRSCRRLFVKFSNCYKSSGSSIDNEVGLRCLQIAERRMQNAQEELFESNLKSKQEEESKKVMRECEQRAIRFVGANLQLRQMLSRTTLIVVCLSFVCLVQSSSQTIGHSISESRLYEELPISRRAVAASTRALRNLEQDEAASADEEEAKAGEEEEAEAESRAEGEEELRNNEQELPGDKQGATRHLATAASSDDSSQSTIYASRWQNEVLLPCQVRNLPFGQTVSVEALRNRVALVSSRRRQFTRASRKRRVTATNRAQVRKRALLVFVTCFVSVVSLLHCWLVCWFEQTKLRVCKPL